MRCTLVKMNAFSEELAALPFGQAPFLLPVDCSKTGQ